MADPTLNSPPFPPLCWNGHFWAGEVVLPSWAGFQSRRGAYNSVSSEAPSDGTVELTVDAGEDSHSPPLPAQVNAFRYLVDNEALVAGAVLQAIFSAYPSLPAVLYGYDDEEAAELAPQLHQAEQLRQLIGLSSVHILNFSKGGIAYIGFEFGCTWDAEHGLGVMTRRDRVVEIGGADTSFLHWIAKRDAETSG